MTTVKLSSKNQMVLPREAREALRVKSGDELVVVPKGDVVVIIARSDDVLGSLKGSGRGLYGRADAYLRKERRSWTKGPSAGRSRATE